MAGANHANLSMTLLLSSDALPRVGFEDLLQAVERRALGGLELTVDSDQAHGVDPSLCPILQNEHLCCLPGEAGIRWMRPSADCSLPMLVVWAGAARQIGAGLLLRRAVPDIPGTTALIHRTDPDEARAAARWARTRAAHTSWEVEPAEYDASALDEVLSITGPYLAHVRLLGGGPEPENGVAGEVMTRLTLHGYSGTIALAPSSPKYEDLWARWLLQKRGWGCGTAAEKAARREAVQAKETNL